MQILKEYFSIELPKNDNIIKEAIEKEKEFVISGICQRSGIKNENGRIYPHELLRREVEVYRKLIEEKNSWSEIDHQDNNVIELKHVCGLMTELYWKGNELFGSIQIAPNRLGKDLMALLSLSNRIGVSSRGLGETKYDRSQEAEIVQNFTILSFDIVASPSTSNAFLSPVRNISMSEAKRLTESVYSRKSDKIFRICNKVLDRCSTHSCDL